jgi:hypothetical protein
MAKVLLVDTNFSSGPIYAALVAMGHEVHVVGGSPQDCLAKVSPHYWPLNYADTDALGRLVDEQGFDYLVPGCTDRSYESCVAINRGRFPCIDTPEANKAINHKSEFRRVAKRLGLPIPEVQDIERSSLRLPAIIKPVDAFSGKGITVIRENDPEKITAAIEMARAVSPSGEFLVEDFVEGQLHSHSAFIQDGRVIHDFLVREDGTANAFVVDTSRVLQHAPDELFIPLRECVEKLAKELQLPDGLVHTQFISNGSNVWLIELTRRCPGDLYSQLIELSTGFPYAQAYALPFTGQRVATSHDKPRTLPIMRHTVTLKKEQSFAHLHFKHPLLIERFVPLSLVGDQLKPSPYSRVGILFCRAPSEHDLDSLYQTTLQRELYEIQA